MTEPGGPSGGPVAYDFRRATRFSAEHLRGLSRLQDHMVTLLQTYMTAYLRAYVRTRKGGIEATTYEEFVRQAPSGVVVAVVELAPLRGRALLLVDQDLAAAVVDRLLGGPGRRPPASRPLTEIELRVISRAFPMFLESVQEAFSALVELRVELASLEPGLQFLRLVAPSEAVAVLRLTARLGEEGEGEVVWCLPYPLMEEVLPRLTTHQLTVGDEQRQEPQLRDRLWDRVRRAPARITAELGQARLSGRELLSLEVGDCVTLDRRQSEPVTVQVAGRPKYLAWVRVRDRRLVLKLATPLDLPGAPEGGALHGPS